MHDIHQLAAAATALADPTTGSAMFEALQPVAALARVARYPLRMEGDGAVLNSLLELVRQDTEAYERVLALVEARRAAARAAPLRHEPDGAFDKSAYMRAFMDQKRQRQRRAVLIENAQRPERDQLEGRARLDFSDAVAARWKARLDDRLELVRTAHGGRAPKDALDLARAQFWESIDAELDEAEKRVRRK
jgi:hypothetical protein